MSLKGFVIAIDGPVAAGKGTIAPRLAKRLNGFYLYTGAMYRSLALLCLRNGIDFEDDEKVISLLPKVNIEFSNDKIFLNDEDVTEEIKDEDVAIGSSKVAVIKKVREHMVQKQREVAGKFIEKGKIVISEGRDTGTIVFPDAKIKIFLTATVEERAKRRLKQLKNQKDEKATLEKTLEEIKKRDKRDSEREVDPLPSNPKSLGYFILDNSDLTKEETLDRIMALLNK